MAPKLVYIVLKQELLRLPETEPSSLSPLNLSCLSSLSPGCPRPSIALQVQNREAYGRAIKALDQRSKGLGFDSRIAGQVCKALGKL